MMILSDEEIEAMFAKANDGYVGVMQNDVKFARAIEAAILAKLASAELPEPELHDGITVTAKGKYKSTEDGYTADQLRQAYAQGAASQLSAEPVARYIGTSHMGDLVQMYEDVKRDTDLYTRRQAND